MRWGFQMMALAGGSPAGTFTAAGGLTQVIAGAGGRTYIEHTAAGTFAGQTGGAVWTVSWTAPATDVGPVTFYAGGNQANNDGNNTGDQIRIASATSQPQTAAPRAFFDYDGDGRSDVAVFRPSSGIWYFLRTTAGFTGMQWGISTDKIVPADYDGDRKTDVAVFRPENSTWYIFNSLTSTFTTENWGGTGDLAVPADYDGDGKADVSVYRPSDANWYRKLSGGGFSFVNFGTAEDRPVPADYDGDGKADIAVYRSGTWYILRSTNGETRYGFWGIASDTPVSLYRNGLSSDLLVYRESEGRWYNWSTMSSVVLGGGGMPVKFGLPNN